MAKNVDEIENSFQEQTKTLIKKCKKANFELKITKDVLSQLQAKVAAGEATKTDEAKKDDTVKVDSKKDEEKD